MSRRYKKYMPMPTLGPVPFGINRICWGPGDAASAGPQTLRQLPDRHTVINKFISYLMTENVTFGRRGII